MRSALLVVTKVHKSIYYRNNSIQKRTSRIQKRTNRSYTRARVASVPSSQSEQVGGRCLYTMQFSDGQPQLSKIPNATNNSPTFLIQTLGFIRRRLVSTPAAERAGQAKRKLVAEHCGKQWASSWEPDMAKMNRMAATAAQRQRAGILKPSSVVKNVYLRDYVFSLVANFESAECRNWYWGSRQYLEKSY